ncbi:hypothetical protein C8J56DRAFT_919640 [Mycena floridula]|nr:hypothetical protein C8J56DRAFT_919640 [Mycena floridula]
MFHSHFTSVARRIPSTSRSYAASRTGYAAGRIPSTSRSYAISVKPANIHAGKRMPRVFKGTRKADQFIWYTKMLNQSFTSPLIILFRDDFTAERLKKLRVDIQTAATKFQAKRIDKPIHGSPTLTVIRSSIFGAALRDFPNLDLQLVERMVEGVKGGYAVLSLPLLDPQYLDAVIRALGRSVPQRPPKTQAEIDKEIADAKADPQTPGRRMKRVKPTLTPDLRVMGAVIEGQLLLPDRIQQVTKMPSLDTLHAQIVGLLSSPATQLAAVLSEASGGKLARTLGGLQKTLEDAEAVKS